MLAEALPAAQSQIPDRPLKRRKTGRLSGEQASSSNSRLKKSEISNLEDEGGEDADDVDDDDDIEFEDVLRGDHSDLTIAPPKLQQTVYRSDDDDDEEDDDDSGASDAAWDPFDLHLDQVEESSTGGDLELTLISRPAPKEKATPRKKAITKAERSLRLDIHKMHVLCLLSHLARRNEWCNDLETQKTLKPLLDKKMLQFLRPKSDLPQFGRAESLKRGIEMVSTRWQKRFSITARGLRRALWADDPRDIQNVSLFILDCFLSNLHSISFQVMLILSWTNRTSEMLRNSLKALVMSGHSFIVPF